jgi:IS30 family transposase
MTEPQKMKVTLIPTAEINAGLKQHFSVAEAAAHLGVAESTIRRAAKKAGVKKIAGRSVRGGILIAARPVPIVITYHA